MSEWRLLDTGVRTAAENMALDEAILEARGQGFTPNTLRFLQFSPPAVLIGRHQCVEQEVRTSFCRTAGIDINRRITGGGAIFFDETQLGWEAFVGTDGIRTAADRANLFQRITDAIVGGLRRLGVAASFRPRNDIEVAGRKISGTGGAEGNGTLLFQGTLLIDFDVRTMLRALRVPVEKLVDKEVRSLAERVTWLKRELGHALPLDDVKQVLTEGFQDVLGITLVPGEITSVEEHLLARKLPHFASTAWLHDVEAPRGQEVLRAIYKAPGGLIRVALIVDSHADTIKAAIITGDFFAYPSRSILDLQAALKDAPADPEVVGGIVDAFFHEKTPHMPGIDGNHFRAALREALERREYDRWDISPGEADGIFSVGRPLAELAGSSILLLPYCAKPLDCAMRTEDDCVECGLCSIGDAYRLAREKGLQAISINNFEHLLETLARCRELGIKGFVGSCCEAFYAKHRSDFEAAGVPGVLIDIDSSTCYDLGEQDQAYKGAFQRQTHLRLDLLRKVLDAVGQQP